MKYRPEIDGLRAIAVIPVILFHAGFEKFSGGFVGVDVFFVISGYLITTIVLNEIENGTFSIISFYERRARRILPALFLVMLVSLPFAWYWLMPKDLIDFSQSLIAVSTFSSNFLFWQEAGYWDTTNELKPLLHTWSLAVEEQYYLFFPPLLIVLSKFKKYWTIVVIILLALFSFFLSQWSAYNMPVANFFLLPTRVWELAIGAMIAYYFLHPNPLFDQLYTYKKVVELLGLIGLLLIATAVVKFDESIPFPSMYALIPTIGTGLIILFTTQQTIIGKFLAYKPLVVTGLISYSAYLLHQPLFAFARHKTIGNVNDTVYIVLSLISIALAYISWKYIEAPFRRKSMNRKYILLLSLIGSTLFIVVGLLGLQTKGFNQRTNNAKIKIQTIEDKIKINHGMNSSCESFTNQACRTSEKPEILIWGDSYAMQLTEGILSSNPKAKIIQITKSVCGPIFDLAPIYLPDYPLNWAVGCLTFNQDVKNWLKQNNTVKYVVLSSPFLQYLSESSSLLLNKREIKPADINLLAIHIENTLSEIESMGITPVIFTPPPANGTDLGACLARSTWLGYDINRCDFKTSDFPEHRVKVYSLLKKISKRYYVVQLEELLCHNDYCQSHIGSTFLYMDSGHLSREGSSTIGKFNNFYRMITNNSTKQP